MTVLVCGADHLERQRIRRGRAVLLDVLALRVARAADKRAELASLADQRAFATCRTGVPGPLLGRWLITRQRSALLVLRIERAGQKSAVPPKAVDHRMAQRADLVGRLRRDVFLLDGPGQNLDPVPQRSIERLQERHPGTFAPGNLIEFLLHPGREGQVDVLAEVLDEEIGDDLRDGFRAQSTLLDPDVAAIGDRGDGRGVRRWSADPMLFEGLDQGRFRKAGRRLGEMLRGRHVGHGRQVIRDQSRQAPGLLIIVRCAVVATFRVDAGETIEQDLGGRGSKLIRTVREFDRRGLQFFGRHLRGERPLPDEAIQAKLVRLERTSHGVRISPEARRPDRLVRFLGPLGPRLVDPSFGHRILRAVALPDDFARLTHRDPGDGGRIGAHVGDESALAAGGCDTLVQPLRDGHRALGAEAQTSTGLLLQRGGRERRCGRSLLGAGADLRHSWPKLRDGDTMPLCGGLVADVEGGAVDPHDLRRESLATARGKDRLDRPVLACGEGHHLALALHDQTNCDRLDTTSRQPAVDHARQKRAQRVADKPVHDAAGLLGVDEMPIDVARVRERLADRRLRDLTEGNAEGLGGRDVRCFRHVPGDRFTLSIEVRGEVDHVRALCGLFDVRDLLASVLGDHVIGREIVIDIHAQLALARILGQVTDVAV